MYMYSNFSLTIADNNGSTVTQVRSRKKKRILYFIQADKTIKPTFYVKVTYTDKFYNDGLFTDKQKLLFAIQAFTER